MNSEKGRLQKKSGKSLVFCKTGGGVSEGSKMPNLYFGKVFFQLACRIILGPPKHVLHLVWSCLNIYLGGGVRGEFGKRPDFFRILICAPFPKVYAAFVSH